MRINATTTLGDVESDLRKIAQMEPRLANNVVGDSAKFGNKTAKAFASEQHTMFGDTDIEYAPSFTVEKIANAVWVYGPEDSRGDGTQARGYEYGSRNSPGHFDIVRSQDHAGPHLQRGVREMLDKLFWPAS